MRKKMTVLVLAVLVSVICSMPTMTVLADGWLSDVEEIELNKTYKDYFSSSDYNAYEFMIPSDGTINIHSESELDYFYSNRWSGTTQYAIYNTSNTDKAIWSNKGLNYKQSTARGLYIASQEVPLRAGTYYLVMYSVGITNQYSTHIAKNVIYSLKLNYNSDISVPALDNVISGKHAFTADWEKTAGRIH